MEQITGQLIDIVNKDIYPAQITIEKGRIREVSRVPNAPEKFILPGFIDSHIHIESSLLLPSEFARMAVTHGTVATVSDPHEIGNVMGTEGVEFMIANGNEVPFKFYFGAPSCVPATPFETSGATIDVEDVGRLLAREDILYLSEMMNWPGVLARDETVMSKIQAAHDLSKPVDGHAPGLMGADAVQYIEAGISTDHECITYEEAKNKVEHGMMISIREGSAARNFEALAQLIDEFPDRIMLCSDDKHPDELLIGHINQLVARAVNQGLDLFNILKAACLNPVHHYGLNVGLLNEGDPADFIMVENLKSFEVIETWIDGACVARDGQPSFPSVDAVPLNNFVSNQVEAQDLIVTASGTRMRVIRAHDGQLITSEEMTSGFEPGKEVNPDISRDLLKLSVVNRYKKASPALAFITGFGLKKGALASSVGHDSHNITVVGCNDEDMKLAIDLLNQNQGGLAAVDGPHTMVLPLPFGGLMTSKDGWETAQDYIEIDQMAKTMGSTLRAPFMTLSFMSLLVIPDLKLSDKGLFSGSSFDFVDLFIE